MIKRFGLLNKALVMVLMMGLLIGPWAGVPVVAAENPYPVSQNDYQFLDKDGKEDVGGLLAKMSGMSNGYLVIVNTLEDRGQFDKAVDRLNEYPVPNNVPIEIYTAYKSILECKRGNDQVGIAKIVRDNLGALIMGASTNAPEYGVLKEVRALEGQGRFTEAANLIKSKLSAKPDAIITAYQASLRALAVDEEKMSPYFSDKGVLKMAPDRYQDALNDMEAAYAMSPGNTMIKMWLDDLYNTVGKTSLRIYVDGSLVKYDVNPVSIGGRTMVPFRALAENLGAQVQWNSGSRTVTMTKGSKTIVLTVGRLTALVDGDKKTMDVAATIVKGRTMVPLRFISENMDADVTYDARSNTIRVTTK